jgi:ATP-dependent Lon protease
MDEPIMASFDDLSFSSEQFEGKVRLFPLPNLVLFPHVMQPLHIFEPRYRRLLEDSLSSDHLIGMALLAPGWEKDYEGRPPLYSTACLARITSHHRLEDGTYNLLILGLQRIKLVHELEANKLYREAEVELCQDDYPLHESTAQVSLQRRLREAFVRAIPTLPEAHEQMDQLMAADVPLGVLADVISFMLDIDIHQKEALLTEVNVYRRAELLLNHLTELAGGSLIERCGVSPFPPSFSDN